ncbi:putative hydrolase or acyltransferase of alpha beta superfamily protein [Eutypa lata UCREL1]|uniref:Putative hydrolase or acyltransferase of alpha beta superfamily protein n=1 Tax=Eutypa lata (strain UCR-EL1) TaxID=1287681 RepID=M7SN93_EUTLA|nr:putative hydrolase or acyltransferase of alpha beta superfamily protein [Eutypa lata UCREL1]
MAYLTKVLAALHLAVTVATAEAIKVVPFNQWHHQRILTWHTIGPLLAQNYTVICPDNRGMGASTIPLSRDYTSETVAGDFKAILDFFGIEQAYFLGHDKGAPPLAALAMQQPSLVSKVIFAEMMLPAFGFENLHIPKPWWDTFQNWHLAWYLVPEVAAFFAHGRVKELLTWYIWHGSYSGISQLPHDHLESYTRELSKPGYLEAGFGYFKSIWKDGEYFNRTLKKEPLKQPILVLGGESNFAPAEYLHQHYDPVGTDVQVDVIPHAGHWIGEENPQWTASRIHQFLSEGNSILSVDLSSFVNRVTLSGADTASAENLVHYENQAAKQETSTAKSSEKSEL